MFMLPLGPLHELRRGRLDVLLLRIPDHLYDTAKTSDAWAAEGP